MTMFFPRIGVSLTAAAVMTIATAGAALAQYPDTYVSPKGVLRISFEPWYINYDRMFDNDGNDFPIGAPLTTDSAGADFFPSLLAPQTAIRSITGDSTYQINAGVFKSVQDADVRLFPFDFHFGLTDRITLTASIPVVTTRMQVEFTVDSTNSTMGWNQAAPTSGNATGLADVVALLGELEASIAALGGAIASNGFDCPSGPQCDAARDLLARAQQLALDLVDLTGVMADGSQSPVLPPFSPLASSPAGEAILGAINSISAELQSLGVSGLTTTLPLPEGKISVEDVNGVLTTPAFGYDAAPLEFVKITQRLGDLELGMRWGLLQSRSLRAILSGKVRLPTGTLDSPGNFVDLGTGDKQTDVQVGLDAAIEPGSVVSLALSGYYNFQFGHNLARRPTSLIDQPIVLAAGEQTVSRNLGDEFRVAAYPAIRLAQGFTVFGSIDYFQKELDQFGSAGTPPENPELYPPELLELNSSMKRLTAGGGIHYRSLGRDGTSLPIEAGAYYFAAFKGSGGMTPVASGAHFYLRLFWRLFGGGEADEEPEEGN
jgi:hypothetical protein